MPDVLVLMKIPLWMVVIVVLVAEVLLLRGFLWSLLVAEALLLLVEVLLVAEALLLVSVFVWC
jgi:hypothetical protein